MPIYQTKKRIGLLVVQVTRICIRASYHLPTNVKNRLIVSISYRVSINF